MSWLIELMTKESVGQSIAVLALVCVAGLGIGNIRIRGIGLGVAGVLFAGLIFAHFGVRIQHNAMEFARDFGLILFVYTLGMQVGPGFLNSFRKQGIPLNLLSALIVALSVVLTLACYWWGGVPMPAAVGVLSGATTNTPSLGAAQQALQGFASSSQESSAMPGLGYAVAYPFGVIGIILSIILLRWFFRIRISDEEKNFRDSEARNHPEVVAVNLAVTNPNLAGVCLGNIPGLKDSKAVVSRLEQNGAILIARDDLVLQPGNTLMVVGHQADLDRLKLVIGGESKLDLRRAQGAPSVRHVVLTNKDLFGKSLGDLELERKFDVRFTRINRAEVELPNPVDIRLQAGDALVVVGQSSALAKVAGVLGDSVKDLNQTQVVSIFIGIVLGIVVGSIPFSLPGVPVPIKLGLAGGPLLVAIFLSHTGRIGPFVWHMPQNANILLREMGIVLFLACVGLKAGGDFVGILLEGDGFYWMGWGALITLAPLLIGAFIGRKILKLNYLTLSGLMAGSMTDPPALAFASAATATEAPAISYSTVYPLTMLLRVVSVQILVLAGNGAI